MLLVLWVIYTHVCNYAHILNQCLLGPPFWPSLLSVLKSRFSRKGAWHELASICISQFGGYSSWDHHELSSRQRSHSWQSCNLQNLKFGIEETAQLQRKLQGHWHYWAIIDSKALGTIFHECSLLSGLSLPFQRSWKTQDLVFICLLSLGNFHLGRGFLNLKESSKTERGKRTEGVL